MSFPISIQAGHSDDFKGKDGDLIGELADTVIDFTSALLAKLKMPAQNQTSKGNVQLASVQQRLLLAQNTETSTQILDNLSSDNSSEVRIAVVFNSSTPVSVLIKLAHDTDRFVSAQAKTQLSMAA
ncbi:MAG: hypothetical protein K2X81_15855 [Candidatus Obscuribacterales bacterium]|nr:hypothetical protein [Candidatus Obscuribacterales bacterium]